MMLADTQTNTAINDILNKWRPLPQNLFEVVFEESDVTGTPLASSTVGTSILCKAVTLGDTSLSFTRNELINTFKIDSFKQVDTITIEWWEDAKLSVRKFHEEWFDLFFDRDLWAFKSGNGEKRYKTARIVLPIMESVEDVNIETLSERRANDTHYAIITLQDLLPTNIPALSFSFGKSEPISYTMQYKIKKYNIEYGVLPDKPAPELSRGALRALAAQEVALQQRETETRIASNAAIRSYAAQESRRSYNFQQSLISERAADGAER
jgi:hypothetical protein